MIVTPRARRTPRQGRSRGRGKRGPVQERPKPVGRASQQFAGFECQSCPMQRLMECGIFPDKALPDGGELQSCSFGLHPCAPVGHDLPAFKFEGLDTRDGPEEPVVTWCTMPFRPSMPARRGGAFQGAQPVQCLLPSQLSLPTGPRRSRQ